MARRIRENIFRVVEAPELETTAPTPSVKPLPRNEEITQNTVEADEVPAAPSAIQPERAQQYFENVPDEFGAWHIFVCHLILQLENTSQLNCSFFNDRFPPHV